ncbi:BACON domain-containing protein [Pontiellaceae bacterium B1224]|nr:BACON domain-containing protein [Pontiellaceae bacterium B1224]
MKTLISYVIFVQLIMLFTGHSVLAQTNLIWDQGISQSGTEIYSNTDANAGSYLFSITTTNTANNVGFWRTVLNVTSGEANLYISTNAMISTSNFMEKSENPGHDTIIQPLTAGETWYVLVESEANSTWNLFAGDLHVQNLTWDPGNERLGTEVLTNSITEPGSYLYKITTPAGAYNLWRTVLRVESGEADLYMKQSVNVSDSSYTLKSEDPGHDTITQSFSAGQTWYILVEADANTQWSLFAGDLHVVNLSWDPGAEQMGTLGFTNTFTEAGSYLFKIDTETTAGSWGHWRTVLRVESGEADLYMKKNVNVSTNSYTLKSDSNASDAITQPLQSGETWYILVEMEDNADWNIFAGDLHVESLAWDPGTAQLGTTVFDNPITAEGSYLFEITTQSGSLGLWRSVLMVDGGEADLYLKQNVDVTTNSYTYLAESLLSDTILQPLTAGDTWYLLVDAEEGAEWSLFAGDIFLTEMDWDPGTADRGSEIYPQTDSYGGAYFYRFITELPDLAAWRIALDLTSVTNADLFIRENSLPYTNNLAHAYSDRSIRLGDDGFTRYLSPTTGAGQEWYFLVTADDNAIWNLYSGDVYARDLGTLPAAGGDERGLVATIPPETIRYFKTIIPSEAEAWRIWLQNGSGSATLDKQFYVQTSYAPHPSNAGYYDYTRTGQWLFVPPYLVPGSATSYYVGVPGTPNETFRFDSRQQEITNGNFNETLSGQSQSGFLFKTYRIPVPPQQIAWEVTVTPNSGTNPDVAVRLGQVPNPLNNDAFSENSSSSINDCTTLVPTTLSDGTFYVTVYGDDSFEFNLRNREPILTDIDFISSTTNDVPDHVGWSYFKVSDIDQQLGQLGWLLQLKDHIPGTEIAIRRNYVPGRWNYRQNETSTIRQTSYNDQSSMLGFLQDPDHEADIWYVGVYYPDGPIGPFILDSGSHDPIVFPVDGYTNLTVQIEPNSYDFYRVTIPAQTNGQDVIGWELRMTEWEDERPAMYIRRDQLPATSGVPYWYYPWTSASWPSGRQWGTQYNDWTGYTYDPDGQAYPQTLLSMAMGAPLQPGSYYVAFYNSSSTVTGSYSFVSSAIGSNMNYDVPEIAFNGGSAVITNLSARAVAYFQVNVPSNSPSWSIRLENTVGESQLYIREGLVPTWQMGSGDTISPGQNFSRMTRLVKSGDERFMLLPELGQATIPAGSYFMMVVSEGQGPSGNTIGTGTSSAILHSLGEAPITSLGTINHGGMLTDSGSFVSGETDLFQFDVGPDVLAIEVRLEDTVGTPTYYLRRDGTFPSGPGYGLYSGTTSEFSDTHITTHASPSTGTWSVVVGQAGNPASGAYSLEVHALNYTDFIFDGGGDADVILPPEEWIYYHVNIPVQTNEQDVLGWELRMTEWINARPTMYIRRDLLPAPYGVSGWYYPWTYTTWPSGQQWGTQYNDWSSYTYDPDGQAYPQTLLSMGMGAPLEPGSYYVGFYNSSQTVTGTFSFASSAIGMGMTYEPQTIAFDGGLALITNLAARAVEYFKVTVPSNTPSWQVELENTEGETQLYIREARVPTWQAGSGDTTSPGYSFSSMTRLKIGGGEHFTLLPENGEINIPAGDYYLMVVSDGQQPSGNTIGTGTSAAILHSWGEADVIDIGILNSPGTTTQTGSYGKGEIRRYSFTVPAGVQNMQIRLDDRVGSPEMSLRLDTNFPYGANYGVYSGYVYDDTDLSIINITEPEAGTWSLMVNDSRSAASIEEGSYTLNINLSGTTDVVFDGGGESGVALPPSTWKYYTIEVPEQVGGQDVVGWELRTSEWSGTRPTMYIRRDELPSTSGVPGWYYPWSYTTWPSGFQWGTSNGDWSQRTYSSDGSVTYPKYLLSMGMGAPLEPGTYYIGFYNNSTTVTGNFSFVSSGIGTGMTYSPLSVDFNSSTVVSNLPARDVKYFAVDVPEGMANWKVALENIEGESSLYIREAHVPTWSQGQDGNNSPGYSFNSMVRLDKPDNEHYILLPENDATTIPGGTYYLMVVSLGDNPVNNRSGSGSSSFALHSLGEQTVPDLGNIPMGGSLSVTNLYEAGEADNLYRFNVTNSTGAIELRLMDIAVGDPRFYLRKDGNLPYGPAYGLYSGYSYNHYSESVFTVPNPGTGTWSVVVADHDGETALQNGEYRFLITHKVPAELNFDALLNTNGNSNMSGGLLADNQRDYYRVDVPAMIDGEPIVGWYLTTTTSQGAAQVRVRKDLPPDDAGGGITQSPFSSPAAVVVPPLLTPGTWYVEVKGGGVTSYTLTSSAIWMEREWTMPAMGEAISTPGLDIPLFGDSGVDPAGDPLPIDQGIDLENGYYHFYSVTVPENNAGLLRTQLEAISGNPNLYIRVGNAPTLDYYYYNYQVQYDHRLDSNANTEYGNWVPHDGRYADRLEAGTWYIMVKADGDSNARYRLKLSGGNVYAGGNVQSLMLNDSGYTVQLLAEGDWRHYRVEVPTNAPVNWNITYSQESGNVDLYLRDTVPPGNSSTVADNFIRDWNKDQKNTGNPRPTYPDTGTHTLNVPPLRPGHVYYLGFLARSDASFSISSATSGGTIPSYEKVDFETGFISTNIPAGTEVTYQVEVPPDAVRWIHSTTNTSALNVYLEQGTLPSKTTSDHRYWFNGNGSDNRYLLRQNDQWPWRPNQTYYFTVVNPGGTSEPFSLVMNGSRAPEIPQNLSATDGTRADDVLVSWSSITGVGNYEVWRNTVDDPSSADHIAVGHNSSYYYDTTAEPGQLYYYWASVAGKTNTAWFSDSDSGWRPGSGTISPAMSAFSSLGGSGTIEVTAPAGTLWTAAESLNWITIDSGLTGTNNGTVAYSVSAYGNTVARTGTVTVASQTFTVIQQPLGVPVNVRATDGDYTDRTEITWDPLAGATTYYIYRNHTNTISGASYRGNVSSNIYSDLSGEENRTYFYFVRSRGDGGYGGYSAPDTGHRGNAGVTPEWMNQYFPGGYSGELRIENWNDSPAGYVIHWTPLAGCIYGVLWAESLADPFATLADGIVFPQGSYTDTVHAVEETGFYRLTVLCSEGDGYPGDDADSDGDGYTNYEEFVAGTDPTNPLSHPGISIFGHMSPGGYVLNWVSVSGQLYGILWTDDLLNPFVPLTNGIPYPIESYTDTVHTVEDTGFYRLEFESE